MTDNYLLVSDLQIPFHQPKALEFCLYLMRHFKIPKDNVINMGDETDQYFGGLYKRSPNARHTPHSEFAEALDELKRWYVAFPKMRVCKSNHMLRWYKKAWDSEIPDFVIKKYEDMIEAPQSWVWRDSWLIKAKHPFKCIHGMGYSGEKGHINAAMDLGISTAIGHLHSNAGVHRIETKERGIWGMNTGCLILPDEYAFEYGQDMRRKPCIGTSVVLDSGKTPLWVPFT